MDEMDTVRQECTARSSGDLWLRECDGRQDGEYFRTLFEEAPVPYQSLGPNGRILLVNEAWLGTLGYSREEVIGRCFGDLLRDDEQALFLERFPRFTERGYLDNVEFHLRRRDGSMILVSFTGRVAHNLDGSFRQTHCIFHDITARQREQARRQLDEERLEVLLRLHQMTAATPDQIAKFALDASVRLTSSQAGYLAFLSEDGGTLTMWAYTGEMLDQCRVADRPLVFPVAHTGLWGEAVRQRRPILTNDYAADNPMKHGLPEGHVPVSRVLNVPVFDGERIVALVGVGNKPTDYDESDTRQISLLMEGMWGITQRQRAVQALKESEHRLQLVLDATSDGFWDWDIAGGHGRISTLWADLLGYPHADLEESFPEWAGYVHPSDEAGLRSAMYDHLEGRSPLFSSEFRLRTVTGNYLWVLVRGKVVERGADGKPMRMTGTGIDITERKRMAEQLLSAQKMESVGRLAGGVAHDFNNLLTAISGYAELLEDGLEPGDVRLQNLTELRRAADRATRLTRQLLAFARKQRVDPRTVCVRELIAGIDAMVRRLLGAGISIDVAIDPGPLWVFVDPGHLERVLLNLVLNARDAMPQGGTLAIEAHVHDSRDDIPAGSFVGIHVSDTGTGMPPEVLARAFEPFFTTKPAEQGTGLGLSICHGIVSQSGGHIRVDSSPGSGTTVRVYLPRAEPPAGKAPEELPRPGAGRGTETLLLVEDEPLVRRMAAESLRGRGYTVLDAEGGEEASAVFEAHGGRVDLLVTDIVMPGETGPEVARRLREAQPELKVLFVSGYTESAFDPSEHGEGTAFLPKPFTPSKLARRVRELLDS